MPDLDNNEAAKLTDISLIFALTVIFHPLQFSRVFYSLELSRVVLGLTQCLRWLLVDDLIVVYFELQRLCAT
jgi:hypothetical protein